MFHYITSKKKKKRKKVRWLRIHKWKHCFQHLEIWSINYLWGCPSLFPLLPAHLHQISANEQENVSILLVVYHLFPFPNHSFASGNRGCLKLENVTLKLAERIQTTIANTEQHLVLLPFGCTYWPAVMSLCKQRTSLNFWFVLIEE